MNNVAVLDPCDWLKDAFFSSGISDVSLLDVDTLECDSRYVLRRDAAEREYASWIDSGSAGEMDWLKNQKDLKYRPGNVLSGCRSMLVAVLPYGQQRYRPEPGQKAGVGRISSYARGRDYHRVMGAIFKSTIARAQLQWPQYEFRALVDASPLQERFFAQEAGLGFIGRNTLLITPRFGSLVFIGCVLSTLPASEWGTGQRTGLGHRERCPNSCTRCISVCPTGALLRDGGIDARRCISYLTIEHKASIPLDLRPLMGTWIFGCDLCQDVCPFHAAALPGRAGDLMNMRAGTTALLSEILAFRSHADLTKRFAGTPVMRAGWESLVRNACVAAGNLRSESLRESLKAAASCDSEIIREHALWALGRMAGISDDVSGVSAS